MELALLSQGLLGWRPAARSAPETVGDIASADSRPARPKPQSERWFGVRNPRPQRYRQVAVEPFYDAAQPRFAMLFKALRVLRAMARQPALVADTQAFAFAHGHRLTLGQARCFLKPFRPFTCAAWTPSDKLERMREHFRLVDALGGIMRPDKGPPRTLANLPIAGASYRVTIDELQIMLDDGLSVLSLWEDDRRLFTLSFLLSQEGGRMVALIGGIQGRAEDGVLDIYRALTKHAFGLRPRDLIIEVFQALCRAMGVERILAIANNVTYHFDPYFGDHPMRVVRLDYDTIWRDRGGRRISAHWHELPVTRCRRADDAIPPRKRALYRRRYALIDAIELAVVAAVRDLVPGVR